MDCMVPLESAKVVSIAWKSDLAVFALKNKLIKGRDINLALLYSLRISHNRYLKDL